MEDGYGMSGNQNHNLIGREQMVIPQFRKNSVYIVKTYIEIFPVTKNKINQLSGVFFEMIFG